MSVKLSSLSGTYNVQATELQREKPGTGASTTTTTTSNSQSKTFDATVVFLDDTKYIFSIDKRAKGCVLLESVYAHLDLTEKEYFGLQFPDQTQEYDDQSRIIYRHLRWLDANKPIRKQVSITNAPIFHFRVKFYVTDPSKLREEYTRYHYFMQLRMDIANGKLHAPVDTAIVLAALAVQSDIGDYSPDEHGLNYLCDVKLIPNQTLSFEQAVMRAHQQQRSKSPAQSEYAYLEKASRLEQYGVELYTAKVKDQNQMEIQLGVTAAGLVVFRNNIKVDTFSWLKIVKISFKRKQFFVKLRRDENIDDGHLTVNPPAPIVSTDQIGFNLESYRSCKDLWKSCVEHHTFFRMQTSQPIVRRGLFSSKFQYSGRTHLEAQKDLKRCNPTKKSNIIRSPSNNYHRKSGVATLSSSTGEEQRRLPLPVTSVPNSISLNSMPNTSNNMLLNNGNTVHFQQQQQKAWSADKLHETISQTSPISNNVGSCNNTNSIAVNGVNYNEKLVCVRLTPDAEGRFGFNVKGGADQSMPIIVSRVARNSPADLSSPRLNEGDQVVFINGRDVSQLTHEQVVMFIRASREKHSGELELFVKANMYNDSENDLAPIEGGGVGGGLFDNEVDYVLESGQLSIPNADTLHGSISILSQAVENELVKIQFEKLYRSKINGTFVEAHRECNGRRNRYRDVSPYDDNRVILQGSDNDYINANHCDMSIPGSGIKNRYIAAQGPMRCTTNDFWLMLWQQRMSLIVMLTLTVERGMEKCYQYWPAAYETNNYGSLSVTCVSENFSDKLAIRDLCIVEGSEERHMRHVQYLAWPDHGVPDDVNHFLKFVEKVREWREGMVEPTLVHCSAGVGRTGVLISIETAMCLIEANQPVKPVEIVKEMREQRALMVQNVDQYRFICEAILRLYKEKIVEPLPEYADVVH